MRAVKRPLFAFALAVALVAAVAWVPDGSSGANAANGKPTTLKAAFGSFPDYMDPQLSYTTEGWTAMYDTYIPLLTYQRASGRAGAEVIPGLAKDLPKVTNGGRTYTLFLRQGLKYSDGTRVRVSDFEYAIKRMFKLYSGGFPFYTVIVGARGFAQRGRGGISGITTDNETGKVTIHLLRPSGTFTQLLALPFAAPVPPSTPIADQSFNPPPATGPYAITKSEPGVGWSYVRNPAWSAGNDQLMPQLPDGHVERIEVQVIRDEAAQLRQVLSGKLDWVQGLPPLDRYAELRRKYGGTQFRAEPMLNAEYFWMNTTKPPFNDLRIRKAVNHAVDRSVLRRIYGGALAPSQQVLPPGMPGYRRFEPYPYDMERARRLVAAADPVDRKVTVWTDTEGQHEEAAAYYRRQLERIGFRPRLKVLNPFNYFSVIGNRSTPNLDTGWGNWFHDYPHPDDFFRPLLFGGSILSRYNGNFAQLNVPALNAKVKSLGRTPLNPSLERRYAALDRSFTKLAPWVSYGNLTLATLVSKAVDLDGIVWNPTFGAALTSFRFR
jgi:peptide/nickel transport system substrate-binding protein